MTFSEALVHLLAGREVSRLGWNGNGMYLQVQRPDKFSKMTHPYLVMFIPDCPEGGRLLPWQPAQVDLFSEDWRIN